MKRLVGRQEGPSPGPARLARGRAERRCGRRRYSGSRRSASPRAKRTALRAANGPQPPAPLLCHLRKGWMHRPPSRPPSRSSADSLPAGGLQSMGTGWLQSMGLGCRGGPWCSRDAAPAELPADDPSRGRSRPLAAAGCSRPRQEPGGAAMRTGPRPACPRPARVRPGDPRCSGRDRAPLQSPRVGSPRGCDGLLRGGRPTQRRAVAVPGGPGRQRADCLLLPAAVRDLLRPLAMLPREIAAAIWEAIVIGSFLATLWILGLRRRATWIAVGLLGIPIAWTLAIAQAHAVVTLLLTIGTPLGIALAANIKLFPLLAGVWFLGRRDWRRVGALAGWTAGLSRVPARAGAPGHHRLRARARPRLGGRDPQHLARTRSRRSCGPFSCGRRLLALRLAPTRYGWAAAVTLSTLAPPRLLSYMLMGLLAVLRADRFAAAGGAGRSRPSTTRRQEPLPPSHGGEQAAAGTSSR